MRKAIGSIVLVRHGQVIEHPALTPIDPRLGARHRHMTGRALVLNLRGCGRMVDHFPPHTGLPVRIA